VVDDIDYQSIRPLRTDDLCELMQWCRVYHFDRVAMPQPLAVRFLIGIYQVRQAQQWQCAASAKWQNLTAAAIHWLICAEVADVHLEDVLPVDIRELPYGPRGTHHQFFDDLSVVSQQIVYTQHSHNSTRRSRLDSAVLRDGLAGLIVDVLRPVLPNKRADMIYNETTIMLGELVGRRTRS